MGCSGMFIIGIDIFVWSSIEREREEEKKRKKKKAFIHSSTMRVQRVSARRNRRGGVSLITGEHYLREDISCGVRECLRCSSSSSSSATTTATLTIKSPICVVDGEMLLHHLDWLRVAAKNVVVLESAMGWLEKHASSEVMDWLSSSSSSSYLFSNDHCSQTYTKRLQHESEAQWQKRAANAAAEWYRQHLKAEVVFLSDDKSLQEWASRPECPSWSKVCIGWHEEEEEEQEEQEEPSLQREARIYRNQDDYNAPAEAVIVDGGGTVQVSELNRALTGDRVLLSSSNGVVRILRRTKRILIGSVHCESRLFYSSGGGDPPVSLREAPAQLLQGKRVAVVVDCWPARSPRPLGHVVRLLGDMDDPRAEQEATLLATGVRTQDFSAEQCADLPTDPTYVPELGKREDLRHLPICSVDPPGCTDIDDALHCVELVPGKRWEVGVHIADVSHYVTEGSALDKEARARSTTVYLVDRRVDMLPHRLSGDICSLMSNVDRHAMSVIWTLDADAKIVGVRFAKSLIRSRASLTYAKAQQIIDESKDTSAMAQSLRGLSAMSKKLRARRFAMGALELSSPVVQFVHRDNGGQDLLDVHMYTSLETNSMVEEWMLLANICVAYEIVQHFPAQAMLRRHALPDPGRWQQLCQELARVGVDLGPSAQDSGRVSRSLANAPVAARTLVTRYMQQAQYVCSSAVPESEYWHYGLACPIYTHFTSPIRRYADLCVHRLLAAAIGWTAAPPRMDARLTERTARHINHRHRMAQMAGRASAELHSRRVLLQQGPRTCGADILAINGHMLRCVVPELGIEVQVDSGGAKFSLLDHISVVVVAIAGKDGITARILGVK